MEFLNQLWGLILNLSDSSLLTKILLIYLIIVKRQQDNRLNEVEDKQESMIMGFKSVPSMNGSFTGAYNASLKELRETRDRRSKKL